MFTVQNPEIIASNIAYRDTAYIGAHVSVITLPTLLSLAGWRCTLILVQKWCLGQQKLVDISMVLEQNCSQLHWVCICSSLMFLHIMQWRTNNIRIMWSSLSLSLTVDNIWSVHPLKHTVDLSLTFLLINVYAELAINFKHL